MLLCGCLIAYEWVKISITITYFPLSDNIHPTNPPDNSTMSLAPEDYVRLLSSAFYLHPLLPTPRGEDCVIFGAVALLVLEGRASTFERSFLHGSGGVTPR